MNIKSYINYIKEKKIALIVNILLFILFIFSLILRNYFLQVYTLSIIFFILIFIFIQYFDLDFKYSIAFALILIIACPFLIANNYLRLAEYFGNYTYGFLFIGLVNFYLDGLRGKLKKIGKFKIYKYTFLSIFIAVVLVSGITLLKDRIGPSNYYIFTDYIKNSIKAINKNTNYSMIKEVTFNRETLKEQIMINIDSPKENSKTKGLVQIEGLAIEKNATKGSGIDRAEFFVDGKPENGKNLGYFEIPEYNANKITKDFIQNTYINILQRPPLGNELNYWAVNLEYKIISYEEFIGILFSSREFISSNIGNKKFVMSAYEGVLGRKPDIDGYYYWVDQLDRWGMDRNVLLNAFISTDEFKNKAANYYKLVGIQKGKPAIYRQDIGKKYGKQFYLSGFTFEFDSTELPDGQHTLYVYAHSPVFGWDYKTVNFTVENK